MQRLSGIASLTRKYVNAVEGTRSKILDTRKTLPGWRLLEKYAVRCGGGSNHRMGLYDAIMIKDNHIAALPREDRSLSDAVALCRRQVPSDTCIIIEVDDLEALSRALCAGPDVVVLDNMPMKQMTQAVVIRNEKAPKIELEASGGIKLARIAEIAACGIDRISVGELTHSAPAMDIGLDLEPL
jgi:nicotinate-nucleotide pyrophosphorylase (carboxylating)